MNAIPDTQFTCPACGQQIAADAAWVGQQGSCPSCDKVLTIPGPILLVKPVPSKDCPLCGSPSPVTATWCEKCGKYFDGDSEKKSATRKKKLPIFWQVFLGVFFGVTFAAVGILGYLHWRAEVGEELRRKEANALELAQRAKENAKIEAEALAAKAKEDQEARERQEAIRTAKAKEEAERLRIQRQCLFELRTLKNSLNKVPSLSDDVVTKVYINFSLAAEALEKVVLLSDPLLAGDLSNFASNMDKELREAYRGRLKGNATAPNDLVWDAGLVPKDLIERLDKAIEHLDATVNPRNL